MLFNDTRPYSTFSCTATGVPIAVAVVPAVLFVFLPVGRNRASAPTERSLPVPKHDAEPVLQALSVGSRPEDPEALREHGLVLFICACAFPQSEHVPLIKSCSTTRDRTLPPPVRLVLFRRNNIVLSLSLYRLLSRFYYHSNLSSSPYFSQRMMCLFDSC